MLYVGTSGYSYDDWVGPFYSRDIKKSQMLEAYSREFSFTEINSTYYSMPNVFMMSSIVKKTPEHFKFTVKLHSSMTHKRDADDQTYILFNESLKPMIDSNKLGCLVAQFPYSFHMNAVNMDYIKRIKDKLSIAPICIEFRNDTWNTGNVYKKLANDEIGFVCVDEPDIKGLVKQVGVVTSNIGYVRFHGRNVEKWYNHIEAYERYDYQYTEDTLKEWVPKINFLNDNTDFTFIAFNNHFRAQAVFNAKVLQQLLKSTLY